MATNTLTLEAARETLADAAKERAAMEAEIADVKEGTPVHARYVKFLAEAVKAEAEADAAVKAALRNAATDAVQAWTDVANADTRTKAESEIARAIRGILPEGLPAQIRLTADGSVAFAYAAQLTRRGANEGTNPEAGRAAVKPVKVEILQPFKGFKVGDVLVSRGPTDGDDVQTATALCNSLGLAVVHKRTVDGEEKESKRNGCSTLRGAMVDTSKDTDRKDRFPADGSLRGKIKAWHGDTPVEDCKCK